MNHIAEHMRMLRETDPDLLAMVGQQALPPVGSNLPVPGQPGGDGVTSPPPPNDTTQQTMQGQSGTPSPGEQISGDNLQDQIPEPASPPGQFKNLPTNPQDLIPS
jgi:hypothetical protein